MRTASETTAAASAETSAAPTSAPTKSTRPAKRPPADKPATPPETTASAATAENADSRSTDETTDVPTDETTDASSPPDPTATAAGERSPPIADEVLLQFPFSRSPLFGHIPQHVDCFLGMATPEGEALHRLQVALYKKGALTRTGRPIRSSADAIRWLLWQVGEAANEL